MEKAHELISAGLTALAENLDYDAYVRAMTDGVTFGFKVSLIDGQVVQQPVRCEDFWIREDPAKS